MFYNFLTPLWHIFSVGGGEWGIHGKISKKIDIFSKNPFQIEKIVI
jgi:hypothetical protein